MTRKTVLVVGGGFAGLAASKELKASFDIVLIDPKT